MTHCAPRKVRGTKKEISVIHDFLVDFFHHYHYSLLFREHVVHVLFLSVL